MINGLQHLNHTDLTSVQTQLVLMFLLWTGK